LSSAATLDERASAYLWMGKCQAALGDREAAEANWQQAALTDPTGYYSERALDILQGNDPFAPPDAFDLAIDLESERARAEDWIRTTFPLTEGADLSSPGPLLDEPQFRRGTELWQLGLLEEARMEFESLRQSITTDPAANYRLANHLVDLGLYRTAIFSARQVLTLAGMSDADTMNAPFYFNYIRFGPYFSEIIIPEAQDNGFHPLFLFSLVRQESAFEGFVRSSAGARGLMQIIPSTGQEVAAQLGWPPEYSDEDLYRPMVSVVLGAEYLQTWRERLSRNTDNPQDVAMYASLAAYNGGPGNAMRWLEIAPNDPDLFLEIIRFEETRNYIDAIYEIYNIYRRLYDRSP